MANILAVDDNIELCKLIRTALERDGHRVETRLSGAELTEQLCHWADCILLDVMMPGEDGFAVCRRIRGLTDAPILFLTARTDEASVLEGLGIGADDFLSKPFRVAELRARVAAYLRRQNRTPVHRLVRGGVSFDLSAREAAVGETPLPLTAPSMPSASIWRCTPGKPLPRSKFTKRFLVLTALRTTPP